MFICVWKRMRIINDNLIARIAIVWALSISTWMLITGFPVFHKIYQDFKSFKLCSGDHSNNSIKVDWQEILNQTTDYPR